MQRPPLQNTQEYKQFRANYITKKQNKKFWAYKIIELDEVIRFCEFMQTYNKVNKKVGIFNNLRQMTASFNPRNIYINKYEVIMNNVENLIRSIDANMPNYGLASEIIYMSKEAHDYKMKHNLYVGGRRPVK